MLDRLSPWLGYSVFILRAYQAKTLQHFGADEAAERFLISIARWKGLEENFRLILESSCHLLIWVNGVGYLAEIGAHSLKTENWEMSPSQKVTNDVLVWVNDITRCPEQRLYLAQRPWSSPPGDESRVKTQKPQDKIPGTHKILGAETRKPPR